MKNLVNPCAMILVALLAPQPCLAACHSTLKGLSKATCLDMRLEMPVEGELPGERLPQRRQIWCWETCAASLTTGRTDPLNRCDSPDSLSAMSTWTRRRAGCAAKLAPPSGCLSRSMGVNLLSCSPGYLQPSFRWQSLTRASMKATLPPRTSFYVDPVSGRDMNLATRARSADSNSTARGAYGSATGRPSNCRAISKSSIVSWKRRISSSSCFFFKVVVIELIFRSVCLYRV
jgi:hypothetical protein